MSDIVITSGWSKKWWAFLIGQGITVSAFFWGDLEGTIFRDLEIFLGASYLVANVAQKKVLNGKG
jgi:hypothetical protein